MKESNNNLPTGPYGQPLYPKGDLRRTRLPDTPTPSTEKNATTHRDYDPAAVYPGTVQPASARGELSNYTEDASESGESGESDDDEHRAQKRKGTRSSSSSSESQKTTSNSEEEEEEEEVLVDGRKPHTPVCPPGTNFTWTDNEHIPRKYRYKRGDDVPADELKLSLTATTGEVWDFWYIRCHEMDWSSLEHVFRLNKWRQQIVDRRLNKKIGGTKGS